MPSRLRQFFRRVKPPRAAAGWKPARTSRSEGQDHCPPPSFPRRVNPPRCGRCSENSWIGSNRLGCKSSALRHWPVAQKQSARPISEGRRSVTVQANQFRRVNPVGIRCADSLRNLRSKFLCKHRQRCSGFVNRRGRRKPGAEIHFSPRTYTDVGRRPLSGSPFIFQPTVFP